LKRLRRRRQQSQPAAATQPPAEPALVSPEDEAIIERAKPFTMTSPARLQALIDAVRYCERSGLPGAFAECGVWRGGSVLAMLLTLLDEGSQDRDAYLYDTFEGMTAPTEHDVSPVESPALETWQQAEEGGSRAWPELFSPEIFNEDAVRETLQASGYPAERVHLVRGPVEETIPGTVPDQIALLRLDTDWYESTRHELEHLYPRLVPGGVLIIDDYGHWEGARRAMDEYMERTGEKLLLNRIDYTGRIAVKPA
jgi:hypothetical protein